MRFAITSSLLIGAAQLAYSAPAPQSPFLLQGDAALNLPAVDAELPKIPELNVQDFIDVEKVKNKIEGSIEAILHKTEQAEDLTAATWPSHPPVEIDFSEYTILEIVNASLHHHHRDCKHHHHDKQERADGWKLPWSQHDGDHEHGPRPQDLPLGRLAWLVNISSDSQELLKKDGITLLAPDNMALTPPHRRRPHGPHHSAEEIASSRETEEEHQPVEHPFYSIMHKEKGGDHDHDHDHDEDRERRRRFFEKVVGYVLSYHTIPEVRDARSLVNSSTVATSVDSSRLKVEAALAIFPHPYPTVKFNGYSYKRGPTIKAKNGIIHLVGAPLLPPLSPLNQLFLFPQVFSTLTSGLQKVDLADGLVPHWSKDTEAQATGAFPDDSMVQSVVDELMAEHKSARTFTVFAPGQFAFNRLGPKVLAFLHSPFPISRVALKYVLSYHVVPDIAFFSDFVRNDTDKAAEAYIVSTEIDTVIPRDYISDLTPQRGDITHYNLPTLLSTSEHGNPNATLKVAVVEYRSLGHGPLKRAVVVVPHEPHNDHERMAARCVKVFKTDIPARNGAIQWLTNVLPPPWPQWEHKEDSKAARVHQKRMHRLMEGLTA